MSGGSDQFEVRRIPAGTPDHHRALQQILGVERRPAGTAQAPQVASPLADVRRPADSIDLLLGTYQRGELVSACLAVESPGAAALVIMPADLDTDAKYRANVMALKALQTVAWRRRIALLEVLVAPGSHVLGRALHEAGFRYLTSLRYLKRQGTRNTGFKPVGGTQVSNRRVGHRFETGADLEWLSYTPDRELLFQEAVERTYVQSMDCPELTGLRRTAEVLAGHRATGVFDPALWRVARRGGEPVGVMLLNQIPSEAALEVVYMGVAQVARGTGVADALLQWAVEAAAKVAAATLALAVDERNTPAHRMYQRWGFVEIGARDAWIASSPRP